MRNNALNTKVGFLILGILLSIATVGALLLMHSTWDGMAPATCVPNCFCEAVRIQSSFRQPANTWSSLAFVLSGTWIFGLLYRQAQQRATSRLTSLYAAVLAGTSIMIGIGSAFLHASLTLLGQFLDVLGMYLLSNFMLLYASERLFYWKSRTTIIVYVLLTSGLAVLLIHLPESRRYVFAIIILLALILEVLERQYRKPRIQTKWWYAGFVLLSCAYVIWILDNRRVLCSPYSVIQGHSVWHISGAIAVVLLYRYYASELRDHRSS
jgi:hypothetical protein